ncbi:MAG: hypothetical protein Q8P67_05300, partial [archaeon]|nr:hypothetical protein [archaeon]
MASSRFNRLRSASAGSSEPLEPLPVRFMKYADALKDAFVDEWELRMRMMKDISRVMGEELELTEENISLTIPLVAGLLVQLKEHRSAVSAQASKTLAQVCLTMALVPRFQLHIPRIVAALSERLTVTVAVMCEAATKAIVEMITGMPIDTLPQLTCSILDAMGSHPSIRYKAAQFFRVLTGRVSELSPGNPSHGRVLPEVLPRLQEGIRLCIIEPSKAETREVGRHCFIDFHFVAPERAAELFASLSRENQLRIDELRHEPRAIPA